MQKVCLQKFFLNCLENILVVMHLCDWRWKRVNVKFHREYFEKVKHITVFGFKYQIKVSFTSLEVHSLLLPHKILRDIYFWQEPVTLACGMEREIPASISHNGERRNHEVPEWVWKEGRNVMRHSCLNSAGNFGFQRLLDQHFTIMLSKIVVCEGYQMKFMVLQNC